MKTYEKGKNLNKDILRDICIAVKNCADCHNEETKEMEYENVSPSKSDLDQGWENYY